MVAETKSSERASVAASSTEMVARGSTLALLFGGICYLAFLVSILYFIGFMENFGVPAGIDAGAGRDGFSFGALVIDLALIGLFAVQHSVMARPGFKAVWTRVVPPSLERSVYVLLASALLFLLCWQWRPLTGIVWRVENPVGRVVIVGVSVAAWGLVVLSSYLIDHFDLFGLRQVFLAWRRRPYNAVPFRVATLYRLVRHPMMLGFVIAFWATPLLTVGHLLFAVVATGYVLVAVRYFEERDLAASLGAAYVAYQRRVPMFLPIPRRG